MFTNSAPTALSGTYPADMQSAIFSTKISDAFYLIKIVIVGKIPHGIKKRKELSHHKRAPLLFKGLLSKLIYWKHVAVAVDDNEGLLWSCCKFFYWFKDIWMIVCFYFQRIYHDSIFPHYYYFFSSNFANPFFQTQYLIYKYSYYIIIHISFLSSTANL